MAELDRVQPGEPVAAAGAAEEDRSLVADQLAAAAGEDGRPVGEACALLLAAVSGRSSDAAGVRGDFAAHLGAARGDWIGRGSGEGNRLKEGGWDGEVFEKSLAKRHLRLFLYPEEADLAPSRAAGVARDAKNESYGSAGGGLDVQSLGTESQNGNSG